MEALVSSSAAGLVMGLHLKAQLEEAGLLPDFSFYPALLDALWKSVTVALGGQKEES